MPVLESTDNGGSTRSALRYRPLAETSKRSVVTTAAHPVARRASRVRPKMADDDLISEWQRGDDDEVVSAPEIQRDTNPPVRHVQVSSQDLSTPVTRPDSARSFSLRRHPLLFICLSLVAVLVLWTLLMAGINWWNDTMDYLHYGYPRTFQVDAVVGHNDSSTNPSHFLATNLHGRIEIIEFPGGDGAHARIYLGPQLFGSNADKAPARLEFVDVNGDKAPDMLVFFQASWILFTNDQGTFRPSTDQEHQQAVTYLATHGQ